MSPNLVVLDSDNGLSLFDKKDLREQCSHNVNSARLNKFHARSVKINNRVTEPRVFIGHAAEDLDTYIVASKGLQKILSAYLRQSMISREDANGSLFLLYLHNKLSATLEKPSFY